MLTTTMSRRTRVVRSVPVYANLGHDLGVLIRVLTDRCDIITHARSGLESLGFAEIAELGIEVVGGDGLGTIWAPSTLNSRG